MIVSVVIYFAAYFLHMLNGIMSGFNAVIGVPVIQAVTAFFSYFRYVSGILPIWPHPEMNGLVSSVGLLTIFGWSVVFVLGIFSVKVLLFIYRLIPVIGRYVGINILDREEQGDRRYRQD